MFLNIQRASAKLNQSLAFLSTDFSGQSSTPLVQQKETDKVAGMARSESDRPIRGCTAQSNVRPLDEALGVQGWSPATKPSSRDAASNAPSRSSWKAHASARFWERINHSSDRAGRHIRAPDLERTGYRKKSLIAFRKANPANVGSTSGILFQILVSELMAS